MFEFVTKREYQPYKVEVDNFIKKIHKILRKEKIVNFRDDLIGSAGRHLITRVENGNKGFDFDYNLEITKFYDDKFQNPKTLKNIFRNIFDKTFDDSYEWAEDSTSVFTIKKVDKKHSIIIFSVDFAIVHYYEDEKGNEKQEYIRFDKNTNGYSWCDRPEATNHRQSAMAIRQKGLWNELRELYLKNKNKEPNKKSRIVYYQTLETIYKRHFQ